MKPFVTNLCVVCSLFVGLSTATATIVNDIGPSWRGDDATTYQAWGFDNDNSPADLDVNFNPYGLPTATVIGIDPPATPPEFIPPSTFWKDDDNGHQGVWRLHNEPGDSIRFYIPNNPVENPQKKIWFQMTYYASAELGAEPEIFSFPDYAAVDLVSKVQLDEHFYFHAIWEITLEPNPPEEWISLKPRDCTLLIDEVVIDTICIPEPSSIVLLMGMSGLIVFVRHRFLV